MTANRVQQTPSPRIIDARGNCSLCGGTHYGSYECPYRCEKCVVKIVHCEDLLCPRNARYAEENKRAEQRNAERKELNKTPDQRKIEQLEIELSGLRAKVEAETIERCAKVCEQDDCGLMPLQADGKRAVADAIRALLPAPTKG